jgi:hypothetical protein
MVPGEHVLPRIRASRAVTGVTAGVTVVVSVPVAAVVLPGRVVPSAASRGRRAAPARRSSATAIAVPVTARVEAPRGRRRSASPLEACQHKSVVDG